MSYPYWRFKVTFRDGTTQDYSVSDVDSDFAMHTLLGDLASGVVGEGVMVKSVEYLHSDTFGIDAESDAKLAAEGAQQ